MAQVQKDIGIVGWGAYVPRRRLARSAIAEANVWFDGGLRGLAKGHRSMANWDEDPITMAVEACRHAFKGSPAGDCVDGLYMASTTFPFLDRHNAVLVSEALNLGGNVRTLDAGGTRRAGTSALFAALDAASAGARTAVVASEKRRARVGSATEMLSGDASAAVVVANGAANDPAGESASDPIRARYLGGISLAADFVDQYRTDQSEFDYGWEERWIRDEGYLGLIPQALENLVANTGVQLNDVTTFVVPTSQARVAASLARKIGIDADRIADNLMGTVGDSGSAHPLFVLADVLDRAHPGDKILVVGFGQGVDALLFEATDSCVRPEVSVNDLVEAGVEDTNYARFQTFNGVVDREFGKRAETDTPVRPSAHWRNRQTVNSFIGGQCRACDTIQFPKSEYCVNPECAKSDSLDDYPLSEVPGRVVTYTADRLTFDMDPPAYFGLVEFDGGARVNLDYTEVDSERFDVGTSVGVHFRIKQFDNQRGFRSYFWKAAPSR